MSALPEQSFASVKRYVTGFHFVAGGLILLSLIWAIGRFIRAPGGDTGIALLSAVILPFLFWYLRAFAVRVQDRVICLEERLRLARLLPADLQSRIPEFASGQLIALRYASDAELPALARKVLTEGITSRRGIMGLVTEWRPDLQRV